MSEEGENEEVENGPKAERVQGPGDLGFGALFGAFGAGLALALIALASLGLFSRSPALFFLVGELAFLAGVTFYLSARDWPVGAVLRLDPVPRAAYAPALALGFALLLANFAATALLGPSVQDVEFITAADDALERALLILAVAVAAPFIEEAVFRGFLQGVLERRFRAWIAIATTGLAFAILHGPAAAIFFFFWSLPVGWVTWRAGSIRPAIVVHGVNNLVGVLGLLLAGRIEQEGPELETRGLVVAILMLLAGAGWALRQCGRLAEIFPGRPGRVPSGGDETRIEMDS